MLVREPLSLVLMLYEPDVVIPHSCVSPPESRKKDKEPQRHHHYTQQAHSTPALRRVQPAILFFVYVFHTIVTVESTGPSTNNDALKNRK